MTTKGEIVDWLMQNEATVVDSVKDIMNRLVNSPRHVLYSDVAKEQFIDELQKDLTDKISHSLGISAEEFITHITKDELNIYVKKLAE